MPDMDGAALWRAVRAAATPRWRARMLFVTGDTLSPGAREFLHETGRPFVDKPFVPADLLEAVRAALDAH